METHTTSAFILKIDPIFLIPEQFLLISKSILNQPSVKLRALLCSQWAPERLPNAFPSISIVRSGVIQTEKNKCLIISLTCESKEHNKDANKTENKLIDSENIMMVAKWEGVMGLRHG